MKELLGLADGTLLVGGFETLRVGLALEVAAHLPIPAGFSPEDAQFGGIVGYGGDGGRYGQCAVPWREVVAVVCRLSQWEVPHSRKLTFGRGFWATG